MKVKIFQFHNYSWEDCEANINEWIEIVGAKVVQTQMSSASTGDPDDRGSTTTLAVWYET